MNLFSDAASSNLAGCSAGTEAAKLETVLGIQVLRHSTKKPAGDVKDLERHFG